MLWKLSVREGTIKKAYVFYAGIGIRKIFPKGKFCELRQPNQNTYAFLI